MTKRIPLTISLLLLATTFCQARTLTMEEANTIIFILVFVVILLIVLGAFSLYYNRTISQRNEQFQRILNALDDYRAIVGDCELPLDKQAETMTGKQPKAAAKMVHLDEGQAFFVKMDARVTKEKPFTDPDFDHFALIDFMGVNQYTFYKLVPRYSIPDRTLEYINSRRAEYAAKILMEHSEYSMDDIARKCGFANTASLNSNFKFTFGVTPTDYLHSISLLFKKKGT